MTAAGRPGPFRSMLARHRLLTVLLGVLAFLSTGLGPAVAGSPVGVDQLLTDRVGALGTEATEVQEALEAVRQETGGRLNVVLVSGFDGAAGADWVEQVATQSEIGSSYLLLAIDVEAHAYEWWLGDAAPWDVTEVEQLMIAAARPQVVAGNWAGAITAVAEGLRSGDVPAVADDGGGEASEWTSATTTAVVGFVLLFLLAGYQFSRRATARQRQPSDT